MSAVALHLPPDLPSRLAAGADAAPGAVAAATGRTFGEVVEVLHREGWTGAPTHFSTVHRILGRLGVQAHRSPGRPRGARHRGAELPRHGLVHLQILGPWTQDGVPPAAALRHTHWVAVSHGGCLDGTFFIFDPAAPPRLRRWLPAEEWTRDVLPGLLSDHPGGTGCYCARALELHPASPGEEPPPPAPPAPDLDPAVAAEGPIKGPPPGARESIPMILARLRAGLAGHGVHLAVDPTVDEVDIGPRCMRVYLRLLPGQSVKTLRKLAEDLARVVGCDAPLGVSNLPARHAVGLDLPVRDVGYTVTWEELRAHPSFERAGRRLRLGVCVGIDVTGRPHWTDLAAMPHLLVAGTTGSGKTVFLRALLLTLATAHDAADLTLCLSSTKPMDLRPFTQLPHFIGDLAHDGTSAADLADALVRIMEDRIRAIDAAGHDDIAAYNAAAAEPLPRIVAVFDEYGETVQSMDRPDRRSFEAHIGRLAQKARAAGIHLILSMQRPDRSVIQGLIKANVVHRVALRLPQATDSRIVLDDAGAEGLLGQGDLLYLDGDGRTHRLQVPFLSGEGLRRLLEPHCTPCPPEGAKDEVEG